MLFLSMDKINKLLEEWEAQLQHSQFGKAKVAAWLLWTRNMEALGNLCPTWLLLAEMSSYKGLRNKEKYLPKETRR